MILKNLNEFYNINEEKMLLIRFFTVSFSLPNNKLFNNLINKK